MSEEVKQPKENMVGTSRIGRFMVSISKVRNDPNMVKSIMAKVIPIRMVYHPSEETFEYMCICDEFDELTEEEIVPIYHTMVDAADNVSFKRLTFAKKTKKEIKDEIMQMVFENNVNLEDFKNYVKKRDSNATDEDFKVFDEKFLDLLRIYVERKKESLS